jgi:hypothetical protein
MNQIRQIAGENYEITALKNSNYVITHKPSKAYVEFGNRPNHVVIISGNTPGLPLIRKGPNQPIKWRGRGIGSNLRALVTLYAVLLKKGISQRGYNAESLSKNRKLANTSGTATNDPTSTWILRQRLGWRANNVNARKSHFNVGANTTKLMNWLSSRGFRIPM